MRIYPPCYIPSNQDIANTFRNFRNEKIISSVCYLPKANDLYCHVYSCPYIWTFYHNITNDFPGGLFKYVREISLDDERPFEHEFFLRIAQSFPFINKLKLRNYRRLEISHVQWLTIQYPHLVEIDLVKVHDDYVDEFLNDKKMVLSNGVQLRLRFDSLKNVTGDFTRDATRVNCSKIIRLAAVGFEKKLSKLKDYFPNAQIY